MRLIGQRGEVIREFKLNDTPNHTGMEVVYWAGLDKPALLYNGGALWSGKGALVSLFEELNKLPVGNKRQGWYHCIAVDLAGDDGEEVILYNPWENNLFIYAANRKGWKRKKKFAPTAKQYNTRLMD